MYDFRTVYTFPQIWARRLSTLLVRTAQRNDADEMELRGLARSKTMNSEETSYNSRNMRLEEAEFTDVPGKVETRSNATKFTSGWRFGAINCAISATVVFLINLIVTIVFSARKNGALYSGDCDHASKLNTALHVFINLLSTILLSSSNYCMQCLSAPTRTEVDEAHAKGKWLDIGVQSIHNMYNIKGSDHARRLVVWLILGLSSLPLHLL